MFNGIQIRAVSLLVFNPVDAVFFEESLYDFSSVNGSPVLLIYTVLVVDRQKAVP